jgi:two-component sensor histidine kinase
MPRRISLLKAPAVLIFIALTLTKGSAEGAPFYPPLLTGQHISLSPYLSAFEDTTGIIAAPSLIARPGAFVPLDLFRRLNNTDHYWLRTQLRTGNVRDPDRVISFNHLTYVDVYLYSGDSLVIHKAVGAFRPRNQISEEDGRLYSELPLEAGKEYTLLLDVHHTKHFAPAFNFELQSKRDFFNSFRLRSAIEAAMMGAILLFFVYTLLSWIVSRYRPYVWLLIFISGLGAYVAGSTGYFIEWLWPDNPAAAWMLNIHFLDLGLFGLYQLVIDFWQLKELSPRIYRWMRLIPYGLVCTTVVTFCIDFFSGDYRLTAFIMLTERLLLTATVPPILFVCWRRLTQSQRYLAYGIVLFCTAGAFITINTLIFRESGLPALLLFCYCAILTIFMLFSIGLKEEMRQNEMAKKAALEELNRLQQHQNVILEKRVQERTEALHISNRRLLKQKHLLAERNAKIETLMGELNHRVKNNLQLLYSLLSLQLPLVKDGVSRDILKGNIGKIRAMMLVNQKLFNFEEKDTVGLCDFSTELAAHLQKIYDSKEKTRIMQDIPTGIRLSDRHTLSFGLILSELLTNTFKHAFKDHPDPCIRVEAQTINDHLLQFVYSDNGVGIAEDGAGDKFTMGIPLIRDLTRQMNGKMTISKDKGLSYSFTIPV